MPKFYSNDANIYLYVHNKYGLILPKFKIGDKVFFKENALEIIEKTLGSQLNNGYRGFIKKHIFESFRITGKEIEDSDRDPSIINNFWRSEINNIGHWVHDIGLTNIPNSKLMYKSRRIREFKEFVNENIRDLLTGKSDDEILNNLQNLKGIDIFTGIDYIKQERIFDYMPPKQDIIDALKTYPNVNRIYYAIICQLPFDILDPYRILHDGKLVYYGSLFIEECRIYKLPDDLTVGGSLFCGENYLTELPKGLKVEGRLDCQGNMDRQGNLVKLEKPKDAIISEGFYN